MYSIIVFSIVLLSFESIIVFSTVLLYCTYYYASEIHFCISKTVLIGDLVNRKICEALESKAGGGVRGGYNRKVLQNVPTEIHIGFLKLVVCIKIHDEFRCTPPVSKTNVYFSRKIE